MNVWGVGAGGAAAQRPVPEGQDDPVPGARLRAGQAVLFTGRRLDPETGLVYFRHRYYAPWLGRFVTPDPMGLWSNALQVGNPYSYVGNAPLAFLDPLGTEVGRKPRARDGTRTRNIAELEAAVRGLESVLDHVLDQQILLERQEREIGSELKGIGRILRKFTRFHNDPVEGAFIEELEVGRQRLVIDLGSFISKYPQLRGLLQGLLELAEKRGKLPYVELAKCLVQRRKQLFERRREIRRFTVSVEESLHALSDAISRLEREIAALKNK